MSGYLVPGDEGFYGDKQFMADLAALNGQLGRYVLRFLDADTGRAEPLSTDDEWALADRVAAVAAGLRARAGRRDRHGEPPALIGQSRARFPRGS